MQAVLLCFNQDMENTFDKDQLSTCFWNNNFIVISVATPSKMNTLLLKSKRDHGNITTNFATAERTGLWTRTTSKQWIVSLGGGDGSTPLNGCTLNQQVLAVELDNTMVRNFTQATWLRDLVEIMQPQPKCVNMYRMDCHNNNDMKHLLAKFEPTTVLLPHPNPNNENNHKDFTLTTETLSLVMNYSAINSTPIIMPFDTDVRVDSDSIAIQGTDGAMHEYCDNAGRKIPRPKQLTAFLTLLKQSTLYNFDDIHSTLNVMMNKHTLYFGPMHIESTNKLLLVHPTYGVVNRTGCELNKNRL